MTYYLKFGVAVVAACLPPNKSPNFVFDTRFCLLILHNTGLKWKINCFAYFFVLSSAPDKNASFTSIFIAHTIPPALINVSFLIEIIAKIHIC